MRKLHSGILENTEKDLAAFVDPEEALSGDINNLRSECLSMLDQSLLNDLEHLVGATTDIRQVVQYLS